MVLMHKLLTFSKYLIEFESKEEKLQRPEIKKEHSAGASRGHRAQDGDTRCRHVAQCKQFTADVVLQVIWPPESQRAKTGVLAQQ